MFQKTKNIPLILHFFSFSVFPFHQISFFSTKLNFIISLFKNAFSNFCDVGCIQKCFRNNTHYIIKENKYNKRSFTSKHKNIFPAKHYLMHSYKLDTSHVTISIRNERGGSEYYIFCWANLKASQSSYMEYFSFL